MRRYFRKDIKLDEITEELFGSSNLFDDGVWKSCGGRKFSDVWDTELGLNKTIEYTPPSISVKILKEIGR